MKIRILALLISALFVTVAAAQDATPEATAESTEPAATLEATADDTDAAPATPEAAPDIAVPTADAVEVIVPPIDDARIGSCSAPTLPDFVPYVVRGGDQLADLMVGVEALTVTQLAALNCIDDPNALPLGAVIWLPATALNTPAAEATPAPVADAAAPSIVSFGANANEVGNLEGVDLSWQAVAQTVYLYTCPLTMGEDCPRPANAIAFPVDYTLSIPSFQYAGPVRFRLEAVSNGETATRDLTVQVTCSQAWIIDALSDRCPETPALNVFAAWQPFENGFMLYLNDVDVIYVFTNDGRVTAYTDVFVEGVPDPAPAAPAPEGLLTPVRGFGQIWAFLGGPESALGYALQPEQGFDSRRQAAGRVSYTTYLAGPEGRVYAVTEIPGVESGYWSQIAGS